MGSYKIINQFKCVGKKSFVCVISMNQKQKLGVKLKMFLF